MVRPFFLHCPLLIVLSAHRVQALTPSVVVSAVSTVTMTCITVFQNSLFFMVKKFLIKIYFRGEKLEVRS